MVAGSLLAFISQMSLLMYFAKENRTVYSEKTLFITVLIYSLLLGTIFMGISYIYDGDTFMFTKNDAMLYYKNSIRANEIGFLSNMALIIKKWPFDDWGSFFYDSLLMALIPNKLFLNLSYMLTGSISSVLLYRISRHYMPESYAFVGALAYGTSSFLILFHCTFLKESLFVTLIICSVYNMCRIIHKESNFSIIGFIFFIGILFFFRPAVAAFIIVSFFVYIAIKQKKSASTFFLFIFGGILFVISLQYMLDMAEHYSATGDDKMAHSINSKVYSGGFNKFVDLFGGFFGPFPTLFTKSNSMPSTIQFYASGLTYRLFMALPLWAGIFLILKNKVLELLPIVSFILVEMLATGMVTASLELRKVFPHIPFTYIVSFYGLSKWQESNITKRIPESIIYTLAIGIILLWNVVKKT